MCPRADDSLPDDPSERVFAQMQRRVRRVRGPRQMFAALGWGLAQLDGAFEKAPAAARKAVACRVGCDFCCSVPVDVQAHEVFFAAEHLRARLTVPALDALVERLAAHRARVSAYRPGERELSRHPCPLLSGGACSIYAARPQPCRAHHSRDAAACRDNLTDPTSDLSRAYIPRLRARLFAVMLSVDAALETEGFDERAYDFGSALHEALTNSACLDAWLRHQPAFPDSCLADPAG